MQNISFVGKIYNMKTEEDKKGNVSRVNLRLAVRKKYVSDEDKKDNKYNVFVPFVVFGKTAELLDQYFKDGDIVGFSNCEYSTFEFENKDGDTVYGHNFKVGELNFMPGGNSSEDDDKKSKKTKSKSKRRRDDDDDDDEEEERPRKKKRPSRDEKPKKKRRPEPEEDEDDDDYEDDDDIDDEDVPF